MASFSGQPFGGRAFGESQSGVVSVPASVLPCSFNGGTTAAAVLPCRFAGAVQVAASVIPMRAVSVLAVPASSLPTAFESADPAHFLAANARWSVRVVMDGVTIAKLTSAVRIDRDEDSNGLCDFEFQPPDGPLLPTQYEGKSLRVSFVGLDDGGSELYRVRRFTGIVERSTFDPDSGLVSIRGLSDVNGYLENANIAAIDRLIGGVWSEHVFGDSSDLLQYARDRLSTVEASMCLDEYGRFRLLPWSTQAPVATIGDSERFNDSLTINRVSRRDLITRVRITLDFRFVRLRHREINVLWSDQLGFCHYLDNAWTAASKEMILSAADATDWTRLTPITYSELPGVGVYCIPARGWAGNGGNFCLGASWRAARRWAQTVTEVSTLEVFASDLEAAVGQQLVTEGYGIQATYDSTDFEAQTGFKTPPSGSAYSPNLGDWSYDATQSESDGRSAMEAAQVCALSKARVTILDRARGNQVVFSPTYRPDVRLGDTLRIVTPSLVCTGNVAGIVERLNPLTGSLDMTLTLALSRHDGAGTASDSPLTPLPEPSPAVEQVGSRQYVMGYHLGRTAFSQADNESWDGYVVNVGVTGDLFDANGPAYRERFVVAMPEIESSARSASETLQSQSYDVAVPDNELTMVA